MTSPLAAVHRAAGAICDEHGRANAYPSPERAWDALKGGAVLVDLTGLGVMQLEGPDTARFCNGMFTNNYRDMPVGGGARSAACDDKGRIVGMLSLYRTDEERFVAVLDGFDPAAFAKRYAMYIVFDDVEMEDLTEELAVLTVQGPRAAAVLEAADLPAPKGTAEARGRRVLERSRVGGPGFDVVVPADEAVAVWEALVAAGAVAAGSQWLEVARVEAGDPVFPRDMSARQMVHDIGVTDQIVHFEKGCYVGQETVNRMEVMGSPKRGLRAIRVDGDVLPPDGAEVQADGKKVGRFTSGVRSPQHGVLGLCIIRLAAGEPGTEVEVVSEQASFTGVVAKLPLAPR